MSIATPSRKQAREAAREERRRREEEALLHAARKRRLAWLGGVLGVAIVVVAVVIAVASGGGKKDAATGSGVKAASAVTAEFAGIPQKGNVLGSPNATATLMVFADMQCPFCAEFENKVMPSLIQRYVRPGKLKIVFQPISIIGDDSVTGAHVVSAAGLQNKEFELAALWYRNQGTENTGYVTKAYLQKLAGATAGLNATKALADMKSPRVNAIVARAASASNTAGINSTPSFMVGKTGKTLQKFEVSNLTASAFQPTLDQLTS